MFRSSGAVESFPGCPASLRSTAIGKRMQIGEHLVAAHRRITNGIDLPTNHDGNGVLGPGMEEEQRCWRRHLRVAAPGRECPGDTTGTIGHRTYR